MCRTIMTKQNDDYDNNSKEFFVTVIGSKKLLGGLNVVHRTQVGDPDLNQSRHLQILVGITIRKSAPSKQSEVFHLK